MSYAASINTMSEEELDLALANLLDNNPELLSALENMDKLQNAGAQRNMEFDIDEEGPFHNSLQLSKRTSMFSAPLYLLDLIEDFLSFKHDFAESIQNYLQNNYMNFNSVLKNIITIVKNIQYFGFSFIRTIRIVVEYLNNMVSGNTLSNSLTALLNVPNA